jgi:predicted AlkP superfamily pyrophosphatase or phosphodiesterase
VTRGSNLTGLSFRSIRVTAEHLSGAHGYLNTDPEMQAIFIAAGYGIRQGVTRDEMKNLSVAPTLARLLGVQLPKTELAADEILQDRSGQP